MQDLEAFTSAPLRLAAKIDERRKFARQSRPASGPMSMRPSATSAGCADQLLGSRFGVPRSSSPNPSVLARKQQHEFEAHPFQASSQDQLCSKSSTSNKQQQQQQSKQVKIYTSKRFYLKLATIWEPQQRWPAGLLTQLPPLLLLLVVCLVPLASFGLVSASGNGNGQLVMSAAPASGELAGPDNLLRHHAHYLNIVPSTHFQYNEGRQANGRSLSAEPELQGADQEAVRHQNEPLRSDASAAAAAAAAASPTSHIYKRSSAALLGLGPLAGRGNPPLVSSSRASLNPLSRRMMPPSSAPASQWQLHQHQQQQQADEAHASAAVETDTNRLLLVSNNVKSQQQQQQQQQVPNSNNNNDQQQQQGPGSSGGGSATAMAADLLLRQKQHIQYHDQWPSLAGKCHKRTLNFCASVLPFNTTTFPNIIGDTNRFEVKRSLPFFGFLAKSSCNRRLDELLCLLLEPPCQQTSGAAIPPCKKFCRLALEGCNEYIPATLALSSVFDCRQYPDSNDPSVCINLAQGSKCSPDEFKCPDKTCIPRNWLCDGVRDCIFAADEANCTAGQAQLSVCSTEEFKCDGKCVPKAWKCDGERDCLDGSDEEGCDLRPRCGPDRFRCADGNGCIPKRWVCDGKAECRDGSDEVSCEQRQCSDNDFKCDNGICIPKLWRCDRQADCRDGSDERYCVYPSPQLPATTTTPSTAAPTSRPQAQVDATMTTTTVTTTGGGGGETNLELGLEGQPLASMVNASYEIAPERLDNGSGSGNGTIAGSPGGGASGPMELVFSELSSTPSNYAYATGASLGGQQPDQVADYHQPRPSNTNSKQQLEQLESSLNGDVSRIIQHELISSSTTVQSASSTSSPATVTSNNNNNNNSEPENNGPQSQSQPQPQPQPQQAPKSGQKVSSDYELIQSSANLVQLNELQPSGSQPAGQQQQQQPTLMANTEHPQRPQQQQQQQQVAMMSQMTAEKQQQQYQQQPSKQQHQPQLMMPTHPTGLPLDQQSYPQANQRVPIYRSLFKTLKGGQVARLAHQLGPNGQRANVVAVARRRRDRNHQQQLAPSQQPGHNVPPPPAAAAATSSSSSTNQEQQQQQQQWAGQQQSQHQGVSPMAPAGHLQEQVPAGGHRGELAMAARGQQLAHLQAQKNGVSSYLQMLNNRYNLRLPRVQK